MQVKAVSWRSLKKRTVDGTRGLVLAIAQDARSKKILMAAYANKQAFEKTLETGFAHYYSTSRRRLWLKGESSGNRQKVKGILVDCDRDALIYLVELKGPSCHTGNETCFHTKIRA